MLDGAARLKDMFAAVPADGHAGRRHDRPRQHLRRLRLLVQGDQGRGQADHRHRGLRRARAPPAPAAGPLGHPGAEGRRRLRRRRLHPHDAARPRPPRACTTCSGCPRWPRWRATSASRGWTASCSPSTPRGSSPPPAARAARSRPGSGSARTPQACQAAADLPRHLRHGQLLRRDHGPRPERSSSGSGTACAGSRRSWTCRSWSPTTRTTPARTTRPGARGAAVRADRHQHGRPRPVQVRRHRLLPQDARRRCGRVSSDEEWQAGCDSTLLIAERADVAFAEANLMPRFPRARRRDRGELAAQGGRGGAWTGATRTGYDEQRRQQVEYEMGIIAADGVLLLLPGRRRLHHVGQAQRHPGRPGPRLGGRLHRGLRAGHHRPGPDQARAGVRAVPQPRARVHARHRHRLRRAPAR